MLFLIAEDYSSNEIFEVIGIFVASAFRLLPSINKMQLAYHRFLWGQPSVSVIYDQITNLNKNKIRKLNFETKDIKNNFNFKMKLK